MPDIPQIDPFANDTVTNVMQITSYDPVEENGGLQDVDKFLLARYADGTGEYFNVSWATINAVINLKATAIQNNFGEKYGIVKVSSEGVVSDLRNIEQIDLPAIDISKITGLQDELDSKVNISFADSTQGYVLSKVENLYNDIDNEVTINYTFLDVSGEKEPKVESTVLVSTDGSINIQENPRGINLTVNPDNAQVQADYTQTDDTKPDYIKNKPNLKPVATSGSYNDLTEKPDFVSGDEVLLQIEKAENNNTYTFTSTGAAHWSKIIGDLTSQTDLMEKFATYYTAQQVDQIIADLNTSILKIKGYISNTDPTTLFDDKIIDGTLWLQSSEVGSPTALAFTCKSYVESSNTWDDVYYTANDFDLWININGTENAWFLLGQVWEKLDFNVDMSKYYTKDETNNLLSQKQNNITGTAGNVVLITDTPGVIGQAKLADVAFSGSFADLSNKPATQVQSDWTQTDDTQVDYIKNKPRAIDLQADWNETNTQSYSYIQNKPEIPQPVQSDWTTLETSSLAYIRHKPNYIYMGAESEYFVDSSQFNGSKKSFDITINEEASFLDSIKLYYNGMRLVKNEDFTVAFKTTSVQLTNAQHYDSMIVELTNTTSSTIQRWGAWSVVTDQFTMTYDNASGSLMIEYLSDETAYLITNFKVQEKQYVISNEFTVTSTTGSVPSIFAENTGLSLNLTFAPNLSTDVLMYTISPIQLISENNSQN